MKIFGLTVNRTRKCNLTGRLTFGTSKPYANTTSNRERSLFTCLIGINPTWPNREFTGICSLVCFVVIDCKLSAIPNLNLVRRSSTATCDEFRLVLDQILNINGLAVNWLKVKRDEVEPGVDRDVLIADNG